MLTIRLGVAINSLETNPTYLSSIAHVSLGNYITPSLKYSNMVNV